MCEYCNTVTRVNDGKIGKRVGGRSKGIYIMKYDKDIKFENCFWLVERELIYFSPEQDSYHRTVPINFCPVCGNRLKET